MRSRSLLCIAVTVVVAGCGAQHQESKVVDRLLDDIAAGGKARGRAVETLANVLDTEPEAADAADPERARRAFDAVRTSLEPLVGRGRPTCGRWADAPAYADLRFAAELVLDVAGRTGAEQAIRRGVDLRDLYLAAWAVRAADRAGVDVKPWRLTTIALDDHARSVLDAGGERVVADLPPVLRELEARARADLTRWLVYPTELGCVPAELDLMAPLDRPEGRYFVFRFRPGGGELDDADVFRAGISGPWVDGALAERSGTFSDFERADSASPEGHLRRILGLTARRG